MNTPETSFTFTVPQAMPFKMVDAVYESTSKTISCAYTPVEGNPMVQNGKFTPEGLIEFMAQSMAAGSVARSGGASKVGYLVMVSDFSCETTVPVGETLISRLEITREVMQFKVFQATVSHSGRIIAKCEIRIFENS